VRAATGVESRILVMSLAATSFSSATSAVVGLSHCLPGSLVVIPVIFWRTKNEFALAVSVGQRQGLQDDVEAVSRLVRKGCADGEPIVVLTFAFDDCEHAV
jgi:hypothetical protein